MLKISAADLNLNEPQTAYFLIMTVRNYHVQKYPVDILLRCHVRSLPAILWLDVNIIVSKIIEYRTLLDVYTYSI
jgi:hypothetical protein